MARPQQGTPKPSTERNSAADKMRMNYDRMRRDIKRIQSDQAAAAQAPVSKR